MMTLSELANMYGIPYRVLYARIYKLNWDLDKALTVPVGRANKHCLNVTLKDLPPLPEKRTA